MAHDNRRNYGAPIQPVVHHHASTIHDDTPPSFGSATPTKELRWQRKQHVKNKVRTVNDGIIPIGTNNIAVTRPQLLLPAVGPSDHARSSESCQRERKVLSAQSSKIVPSSKKVDLGTLCVRLDTGLEEFSHRLETHLDTGLAKLDSRLEIRLDSGLAKLNSRLEDRLLPHRADLTPAKEQLIGSHRDDHLLEINGGEDAGVAKVDTHCSDASLFGTSLVMLGTRLETRLDERLATLGTRLEARLDAGFEKIDPSLHQSRPDIMMAGGARTEGHNIKVKHDTNHMSNPCFEWNSLSPCCCLRCNTRFL